MLDFRWFPLALLALAFGCGIPALIYLAFKGNFREQKDFTARKPSEQPAIIEGFPEPPIFTARKQVSEDMKKLDEVEMPGWEKIYAKVAIKGYVYIPKPVLRDIMREIELERAKLQEKRSEKPAEAQQSAKTEERKLEVRRG